MDRRGGGLNFLTQNLDITLCMEVVFKERKIIIIISPTCGVSPKTLGTMGSGNSPEEKNVFVFLNPLWNCVEINSGWLPAKLPALQSKATEQQLSKAKTAKTKYEANLLLPSK